MQRVASNTLILLGVNLAGAVFGFLIAVLIARGLGADGLGRYSLVMAWTFTLGMFAEFGLNTLITREVARARERACEYLAVSLVAKTALSFILVAALVIAAPAIAWESELIAALQLGSILIWLNALYGSFTAIFRAFEQMRPILILNAGGLALVLAGTYWLVANGQGILFLIVLAVTVQAAQTLAAFVLVRVSLPLTGTTQVNRALLAQMLRAAFPFAMAGIISAIEARANFVLLGSLHDDNSVGMYSAASRFTEAAKFLPNAFFGAVFPAFAAMRSDAENYFRRARLGMLLFSGIVALGLSALAQPILAMSFGTAFAEAQPTLIILAWSLVPALVNGLTFLFLYARGEETFANKMLALALALQLVAAIPLIRSLGASGAACSALIGDIALFALLNRRLRFTLSALRRQFLLPTLIFFVALFVRLILIQQTQFDGLYGQDPYAYLDYSVALKSSITRGEIPPPFFWPIGYPVLVALASVIAPIAIAAQAVSLIASALMSTITFLLTREILRDQPYAELAATVAALTVTGAGQMMISSISVMSDTAALFWAMLSAFALSRSYRDNRARWIALAAFALGLAVTTRWVYTLLIPIWTIALVSHLRCTSAGRREVQVLRGVRQRSNFAIRWSKETPAPHRTACGASVASRPSRTRHDVAIAIVSFFLALSPQLLLMAHHASRGIMSNSGDLQTVSWNLSNAWQSNIVNGDGHLIYCVPIAAFYAQAFAHPSFIFPLLTPFLLFGAWRLHRERFFSIILGGWIAVIFIFLAGIAWENPRFSLAFFPPLVALVGVGFQRFLVAYVRLQKLAVAFVFICIALTFLLGYRATDHFVASQREDRAIASWTNAQLPANATVIAFGITETLKHRTSFKVVEIYNESPESIGNILNSQQPIFALLDIANIESQWKNLSPEINLRALQSKADLSVITARNPYTLFAVSP